MAALVAGSLAAATTSMLAQDTSTQNQPPGQAATGPDPASQTTPSAPGNNQGQQANTPEHMGAYQRASHIIGMEVQGQNGERLGKVQDLVVSLRSDRVPFAIVAYGGAFGIGETRVAVALKDLTASPDTKGLTLPATKEQFTQASPTPMGAWANVANQQWAQDIDRFYGQPTFGLSGYERHEMGAEQGGRQYVRQPAGGDSEISRQAKDTIKQDLGSSAHHVKASVDNGVVTLKGKVTSPDLRTKLETDIKAIPGVDRVDDQVSVNQE